MLKRLLVGCLLAVFTALIVGLGQVLGLDLQHVALLGAALGGVLGLVPAGSTSGRLAGFAAGFAAAWLGFALRAGFLPDTSSGRAVAAVIVVLLAALVPAITKGRVPLWSALVGIAAIVGAYETTYTNSPPDFLRESPTAASTVVFAAALGFFAASFIAPYLSNPGRGDVARHVKPGPHPDKAGEAPLENLLVGGSK
jgi:hypothetical protein